MVKGKRIYLFLTLVVILSFIANVAFFYSKKIEKPLFSYNYGDIVDEKICYITDQDDKDAIERVVFPEIDDTEYYYYSNDFWGTVFPDMFTNSAEDERYKDDCARYNKNYIDLYRFKATNEQGEMFSVYEKIIKNKIQTITKIRYITKSGKENEVFIGKLKFQQEKEEEKKLNYDLFKETRQGSEDIFIAQDDIELARVDGEYKDAILNYVDIYVNEEKLSEENLPIVLHKDDKFKVKLESKKKVPFYERYEDKLYLIARDPEGSEQKIDLSSMYKACTCKDDEVTFKEVDNLIKLRSNENEEEF